MYITDTQTLGFCHQQSVFKVMEVTKIYRLLILLNEYTANMTTGSSLFHKRYFNTNEIWMYLNKALSSKRNKFCFMNKNFLIFGRSTKNLS